MKIQVEYATVVSREIEVPDEIVENFVNGEDAARLGEYTEDCLSRLPKITGYVDELKRDFPLRFVINGQKWDY